MTLNDLERRNKLICRRALSLRYLIELLFSTLRQGRVSKLHVRAQHHRNYYLIHIRLDTESRLVVYKRRTCCHLANAFEILLLKSLPVTE